MDLCVCFLVHIYTIVHILKRSNNKPNEISFSLWFSFSVPSMQINTHSLYLTHTKKFLKNDQSNYMNRKRPNKRKNNQTKARKNHHTHRSLHDWRRTVGVQSTARLQEKSWSTWSRHVTTSSSRPWRHWLVSSFPGTRESCLPLGLSSWLLWPICRNRWALTLSPYPSAGSSLRLLCNVKRDSLHVWPVRT